jgi:cysteine protease ATG4
MFENDNIDNFNSFEIINNDLSFNQNKNRDSNNSIFNYPETLTVENKINFDNKKEKKKAETGIWEYIKNNIINKKNIIIFNIFYGQKKISKTVFKEMNIFNECYKEQSIQLYERLYNLIWFSYRTNFDAIEINNSNIITDAGWGCMIRTGQMLMAQAIQKLYNVKNLEDFCSKYIFLFLDNEIDNEYLCKNENDKVKNSFNSFVEFGNEFIIHGFEEIISKNPNLNQINPPFSLRTILTIPSKVKKNPGEWYSNYDITEKFYQINRLYHPFNYLSDKEVELFNFSDAIIIEKIIKKCFEECICNCVSDSFVKISSQIYESFHDFQVVSRKEYDNNCHCFDNTIKIRDKNYKLTKMFIIFVSARHGLNQIDNSMKDKVLNFFNFKNNIGFIGGKTSKAYYFIGNCENNLIFLDPHNVQNSISINDIFVGNGSSSYKPNDVFYMNINELSPSFTFGFAIKNLYEFEEFINNFGITIESNNHYLHEIKINHGFGELFFVRYDEKKDNKDPVNNVIFYKRKE